ncbi:GATOR complex protein NPRL3 [Eurytemora carolleeae]|uniref:GATOR complex protein NPRL3 n=1 Tax=Eurytemora carolleeae TaxID=1294199 RepID=UPI000C76B982|nr:GATOR complex protein NPRL3 [Eurytemora carolleeae]|eukprot:XP_023325891.1 GATOR complex protein NPRL3-like [Eurytemora affinis]
MLEDTLDPLCIIVVKSGAEGGKLIFKYPFYHEAGDEEEDDLPRPNPYIIRISEDLLNLRVNAEPTNIKDNYLISSKNVAEFPLISLHCKGEDGQWKTTVNMFHIVFALKAVANYSIVQCYHELSQRLGLTLMHEELRSGYLSSQTKCLIAAMDEPLNSLAVDRSSLAKDIQTIYHHLCSTGEIRIYINKWIELSFCLPHKLYKLNFPSSCVEPETIFQCLEQLRPYHTLLFLVNENELLDSLSTDASPALRRLIRQSSPMKSFRTLSIDTDLSLMQVFQLTGHLLYWGKATVIYPICESNIYVLSSTLPIPVPKLLQIKFFEKFGEESLMERLSSFSLPCRLQVPPPMSLHQNKITETIVWLLKHGLIVQLHTYVTLALTPDMAWNFREEREETRVDIFPDPSLDLFKNQGNSSSGSFIDPSQTGSDAGSYSSERMVGSIGENRSSEELKDVGLELRIDQGKDVYISISIHLYLYIYIYMSRSSEELKDVGLELRIDQGKDVYISISVYLYLYLYIQSSEELKDVGLELRIDQGNEREKKKEEALREFTADERESLCSIPAAQNIEDLVRFVHLCKYFRGTHHLEEIMYLENMRRSSLLHLVDKFRDLLIKTEHEDPVVSTFCNGTGC